MEQLLGLISSYGPLVYVLLFGYCALKSGALPLFAGFAAQTGALEVGPVAAATFLGGYLGDELRFGLVRRYGLPDLSHRPRLQRAFTTATSLVTRYGSLYVFMYRYPKGMRTIGALPMGLGPMPWPAFTLLNAASAALWTGVLVGAGYVFGAQVQTAVEGGWGLASVALLAAMALVIGLAWRRLSRTSFASTN
ncbi:hypothetical protein BKI51_05920 [Alphaproteobacteria bacterium AO1-B]|nr:hypothetical protein BKI51_05920 [Alphaproteobacteria bacterium AO1-B]